MYCSCRCMQVLLLPYQTTPNKFVFVVVSKPLFVWSQLALLQFYCFNLFFWKISLYVWHVRYDVWWVALYYVHNVLINHMLDFFLMLKSENKYFVYKCNSLILCLWTFNLYLRLVHICKTLIWFNDTLELVYLSCVVFDLIFVLLRWIKFYHIQIEEATILWTKPVLSFMLASIFFSFFLLVEQV